MIAHNRQSLDNRDIQEQASDALAKHIITGAEYHRIRETHPFNLYSPNVFIRIGLFLLTVLIVACGLGLSLLIGMGGSEHSIGITMIFWGVAAYVALELFILNRDMYEAGVDDGLLWMAGGLVFGGIALLVDNLSAALGSGIIMVLAAWGVLRYADRLMALVTYGAFISLIFHLLTAAGSFAMAITPFVVMAVSITSYFLFTRLLDIESLRHYHPCLTLLRVGALTSFYLAGNYYVVRHVNASLHGQSAPIALSWLWWTITAIVPITYVVAGIRKKDTILLWTGLALTTAAVFTIRAYYHVLPAEIAMILGGAILIVGTYALIRYLRTSRHGFTSAAPDEPHVLENLPVESLVLAETFKSVPNQPLDQTNRFGGGSGGGGGAGGTY